MQQTTTYSQCLKSVTSATLEAVADTSIELEKASTVNNKHNQKSLIEISITAHWSILKKDSFKFGTFVHKNELFECE